MRKAQLYYSNNPKIKLLVQQVNGELPEIEKKLHSQARKQWTKDHPYLLSLLILLVVCILLGLFMGIIVWVIDFFLLFFGGMVISAVHDNNKNSKGK